MRQRDTAAGNRLYAKRGTPQATSQESVRHAHPDSVMRHVPWRLKERTRAPRAARQATEEGMGLADRDYMRRPRTSNLLVAWLRRQSAMNIVVLATALLGLGSAALWFARDARQFFVEPGIAEGSLRVNVNTATKKELESLPGIGPALAAAIIAHRPFDSVPSLERVPGIGRVKARELTPFVVFSGETERQ